jgi:hypothetical protein
VIDLQSIGFNHSPTCPNWLRRMDSNHGKQDQNLLSYH